MAEGAEASTEGNIATLEEQFAKFCNFGNHGKTPKKTLTDKNLTKMFKDSKLYGKALTTADTDIAFNKVKTKGTREITMSQLKELIKTVAPKYQKDHKLESSDAAYDTMVAAISSGGPALHGTTSVVKSDVVTRMTDHTQYTGSHKERFDDTGKGKGIAGRQEVNANDGYVQGYKDRGTYDKKVESN